MMQWHRARLDKNRILRFLNDRPVTIREISRTLKISSYRVGKILRDFELKGKVFCQGGGYCSTSIILNQPDAEDLPLWPKSKPDCWKKVMPIALAHDVVARGYHPIEIIEELKTKQLNDVEIEKLRNVCTILGVDYETIKPLEMRENA